MREVAEYTGFPEMLEGRVKTLHPKVHGGILCRHDRPDDLASLQEHGIVTFELVVVNLYPFAATIARPGVSDEEAIEQIDIGGPSLVRAAAKNHAFVTVATDVEQYSAILEMVAAKGGTSLELRRLAGEAFTHTAHYDRVVADYFARGGAAQGVTSTPTELPADFPDIWRAGGPPAAGSPLRRKSPPAAGHYDDGANDRVSLLSARQRHGKELSFNNLLDLDSALRDGARPRPSRRRWLSSTTTPAVRLAQSSLAVATRRGLDGDPLSAFGSVLGFNREVDAETAAVLVEPGRFIEAIIAPGFTSEAFTLLTTKPTWKSNVRLMEAGRLAADGPRWDVRKLAGGLLVQDADVLPDNEADWKVVTRRQPSAAGSPICVLVGPWFGM